MFDSTVLDLAFGVVFCFMAVSLASGALVEAIASAAKWRAATLVKGVGQLLNDPGLTGLAGELYAHAAVNPRGPGVANPQENKPAYIDRRLFAKAMMDVTGISGKIAEAVAQAAQPGAARPTLESLHEAVAQKFAQIDNRQIRDLLTGIINRSFGDIEKIEAELSEWFDHAMDRVSGAYKRWAQLVSFAVALALSVGLNIDTIEIGKTLWTQPKLVEQLKLPAALAAGAAQTPAAAAPAPVAPPPPAALPAPGNAGTPPKPTASPASAGSGMPEKPSLSAEAFETLAQMDKTLPVGWPKGFWKNRDGTPLGCHFWLALIGWLITALSTLFGAPFWFDILQTVIRLKGSGPSPLEKIKGSAGSK